MPMYRKRRELIEAYKIIGPKSFSNPKCPQWLRDALCKDPNEPGSVHPMLASDGHYGVNIEDHEFPIL